MLQPNQAPDRKPPARELGDSHPDAGRALDSHGNIVGDDYSADSIGHAPRLPVRKAG